MYVLIFKKNYFACFSLLWMLSTVFFISLIIIFSFKFFLKILFFLISVYLRNFMFLFRVVFSFLLFICTILQTLEYPCNGYFVVFLCILFKLLSYNFPLRVSHVLSCICVSMLVSSITANSFPLQIYALIAIGNILYSLRA